MKTHTANTFQHLRAREGGYVFVRDVFFNRARLRIVARSPRSFPSPRLLFPSPLPPPPLPLHGCPMPSTRYEACLITRSVHGPIELPSCRRSPSPLSRSPLESSIVSPFSVRAFPCEPSPHVHVSVCMRAHCSVLDPFEIHSSCSTIASIPLEFTPYVYV